MTNTAARNYNTIEATEIVKNRIREHIREKEAVKSRLFFTSGPPRRRGG